MKKQNKIYSIPTGVFGYNDIHIKPNDDIIVWLDNHGFTHVYYCTAEKSVQSHINIIKKQARDFNSIKYVISNNFDIKDIYMTANILPPPPDVIVLPDDVLADIYNNDNDEYQDMVDYVETDYWVDQYKSGLMDIVEP